MFVGNENLSPTRTSDLVYAHCKKSLVIFRFYASFPRFLSSLPLPPHYFFLSTQYLTGCEQSVFRNRTAAEKNL